MKANEFFFDWGLQLPKKAVSRRVSRVFPVQGRETLALLTGPGCIRRFWITGRRIGRELVLRIYFDDAVIPQVEAPLADFFGVMHNLSECNRDGQNPDREPYLLNTPFLTAKPHNGFTCHFPMPFSRSARIEVENDSGEDVRLYYIIDWHSYPEAELTTSFCSETGFAKQEGEEGIFTENMRFHARWRREAPVRDYQDDFLILDAAGPGRLAGFVHSIDMLHDRDGMRWSHAGSDNLYLDGAGPYPAFLRGIGGEDTFGTSYGGHCYPAQSALFADMPYYVQNNPGNTDRQKMVGYRFFVNDAICFDRSIHFRFGARAHDIAAMVYWYSAAPVYLYTKIPPYRDRLPGIRPRRQYDLPLPDCGEWFVAGPYPDANAPVPPTDEPVDPSLPFYARSWRRYSAVGGFVEFNHVFRPCPSNNNSATLVDAQAIGRCQIEAPRETEAIFTFGWDDRLTFRINRESAIDLGRHDFFAAESVRVKLKKGKNELGVALTNTTGLSSGGWCFSFGAVTDKGVELTPRIEYPRIAKTDGPLLQVAFAAGPALIQDGWQPFVPPYSEDPNGAEPGNNVELICSPQTQTFNTWAGPLEFTVGTSDNTSMSFHRCEPGRGEHGQKQKVLLNGEVRANPHPAGESVTLEVTLDGLPEGDYHMVSYHVHQVDSEPPASLYQVRVNGRAVLANTACKDNQRGAVNDAMINFSFRVDKHNRQVRIAYESRSAIELTGIEIAVGD